MIIKINSKVQFVKKQLVERFTPKYCKTKQVCEINTHRMRQNNSRDNCSYKTLMFFFFLCTSNAKSPGDKCTSRSLNDPNIKYHTMTFNELAIQHFSLI